MLLTTLIMKIIFDAWRSILDRWTCYANNHLIPALGMEDLHGPTDVMNGIPLYVAMPLPSV